MEKEDGTVVYAGGPLALVMDTFCAAHNLSYKIKPSPGRGSLQKNIVNILGGCDEFSFRFVQNTLREAII